MYEYQEKASGIKKKNRQIKKDSRNTVFQQVPCRYPNCFSETAAVRTGIIQKIIEHQVANDREVNMVKRGNTRGDIIASKGRSYFLVQEIPHILDDIFKDLVAIAYGEGRSDQLKGEATAVLNDIGNLKPYIHALVVKYLQVGNCLDFAKLVFAKLVERDYGKWIYECYLDKKIADQETDDKFPVNVKYRVGSRGFDILRPDTYNQAEIHYKGEDILFSDYVKGKNPTGAPISVLNATLEKEGNDSNNSWHTQLYWLVIERQRIKNAYDHAFVITYDSDVDQVSDMEIRQAMVVDAWGGLPARTLQIFLNYGNPYKKDLEAEDIKIKNKKQSLGNPFTYPKIEQRIRQIVSRYAALHPENDEDVSALYRKALNNERIDRVYG